MRDNTETELVRIKNELQAQKQASELSWGQLALPELAPSKTWNGNIDLSTPISREGDGLICKFLARFTRTDGNTGSPLVDFAFDYSVNPTGVEIERSHGGQINVGRVGDLYQVAEGNITGSGDNYVEFTISFPDNAWFMSYRYFDTYNVRNVALNLSVTAISPVKGELTLVRVYDV